MHHGFYSAYHNTTVRPGVISAVQRTKELYGDILIMVTGHSMGGAIASFCALDLAVNIINASHMNSYGRQQIYSKIILRS